MSHRGRSCYNCGHPHIQAECRQPCQRCITFSKGGTIPDHRGQECALYQPRGRGTSPGYTTNGFTQNAGAGSLGPPHGQTFAPRGTSGSPSRGGGMSLGAGRGRGDSQGRGRGDSQGRGRGDSQGRGRGDSRGRGRGDSQGRGRGGSTDRARGARGGGGGRGLMPGGTGDAGQQQPIRNNLTMTNFSEMVVPEFINNSATSALHYPGERKSEHSASSGSGQQWLLSNAIRDRVHARKETPDIKNPKHPLRTEFSDLSLGSKEGKGTNGPPATQVLTNHFNYKVAAEKIWEYKITGISEKRRDKIKRIFVMTIEHWPFLKDHKDSFATNYLDTIVSWKNLHEHIDSEPTENAGKPLTLWKKAVVDGDRTLDLTFNLNREFDIKDFSEYTNSESNREGEDFERLATCLNMVVSKSFNKSEVHQQSANKFFVKNARKSLILRKSRHGDPDVRSHTLELMRGYFYNVKPGMGSFIMNFSLATSAFYRPILVSEFLADTKTFSDEARRKDALKGLRVYVETERKDIPGEDHTRLNSEEARIKRVFGLGPDIGTLTFAKRVRGDDGKFRRDDSGNFVTETTRTSVSRYLNETFDPFSPKTGQPAVNVGTMRDEIWFAQEQLRILPYQIYSRPVPDSLTGSMVQEAAKIPADGRAHIEKEGLGALGFTAEQTKSATSTNFAGVGSPIRLTPTMLRLPCRVLPLPQPKFGKTSQPKPNGSSRWKLPDSSSPFFKTEPALLNYRFVIEKGFNETNAGLYQQQFKDALLNRCNLKPDKLKKVEDDSIVDILHRDSVEAKISGAKGAGADLVVFLIKKPSTPFYAHLKDLADRTHGIHSLCLVDQYGLIKKYFDEKEHLFKEYMTNVAMKINLKMGGITQSVTTVSDYLAANRVMILGADVVHAGPGAYPGTPSIAAIVGSVDFSAGKCLGSMRLQNIDTPDRETIVNVEEMVRERLEAWAAARKAESNELGIAEELPQNIIYYRDGVGTGQYDKIKEIEVAAIRAAYKNLAAQYGLSTKVNVHAVVVVKRHHTRFYPMKASEGDKFGNANTLPGTFVDRLVTSPYYQDFFLQSHSGIKGTVKPTHYFVLEAGIPGLTLDKLRDLTHQICYSYARALCAVSYASPTYYADRLCDRGRTYIRKYFIKDDPPLQTGLDNMAANQNTIDSAARDVNFRIRPTMTSDQKKQMVKDKKEQEKKDAEAVQKTLRNHVYQCVRRDFYMFQNQGWMNPWSRNLADTMFWM